jgi:hypothetical protein
MLIQTLRMLAPLLLLALVCESTATTIHVAANGSDDWSGTLAAPNEARTDGPLGTLERARDEIRRLKADGELKPPVIVEVHAGDYLLDRPFELTEEDSAPDGQRIEYRSAGDGEVRLIGGVEITGFEPYKGEILQADVSGLGLDEIAPHQFWRFSGNVPGFELLFRGERMPLARWPNKIPDDPRWGEWAYIPNTTEKTKEWFHYAGDRPANWTRPEEAQVHFFPWYNYMDQYTGIESIDAEKQIIHLATPAVYEVQPGRRFYVRNVFEELDAPGEWYLDREKGILYFWPPAPLSEGKVVASRLETIVHLSGASNVMLRGFTIESCRGDAVVIDGGSSNVIAGCVVRNAMLDGIAINGGDSNGSVGNDIYEVGRRGILLSGGDRATLTAGRNYADNNHIHHMSRLVHTYAPGVQVNGCGNVVRHNLIHDGPHMVLGLGGNDHVIEYNEIHHAMLISSHGGAFYCGRDFTARGNVIRYNKLHDINGYGIDKVDQDKGVFRYASPVRSLPGAFGVHLDDQISGFHIYGNVFYRIAHGVVRYGGGRDSTIENNIFHHAGWAVHIDNRGMGWQKQATLTGTLMKRLLEIHCKNPPWSERYPELVGILDDRLGEPVDNVVRRNIFSQDAVLYNISRIPTDRTTIDENLAWRGGEQIDVSGRTYNPNAGGNITFGEWQKLGFDLHSLVDDPRFVDPDNDDFRLREDSPAFRLGFEPIPLEKIGLYEDELRASPPPPPDPRKMSSEQVVEEYPIPGWVPPAQEVREPATFMVPRSTFPVTVDGDLNADEWHGLDPESAMVIDLGIQGQPVEPPSHAWLAHDAAKLYVGVRIVSDPGKPITLTTAWGQDDATEVAIRRGADARAPIIVLRGYPDGHFESSREAGAPAADARQAGQMARFAARVIGNGRWDAEWEIPFEALGIDPAKESTLRFNLTVHRSADRQWVMWQGTDAQSWRVDEAGVIVVGK